MLFKSDDILDKSRDSYNIRNRFGIRKLTVGAVSVLLGTTLWIGGKNADIVHADVKDNDNGISEEQSSGQQATIEPSKVVVDNSSSSDNATSESKIDGAASAISVASDDQKETIEAQPQSQSQSEPSASSTDATGNDQNSTNDTSQNTSVTDNEASKNDTNTTSNKIVANQNHKVAQNSTPEGKDTEKIKNSTKEDEKSNDVPKVTNEGPIDRSTWTNIKIYQQTSTDCTDNAPRSESDAIITTIPLVKNDDGSSWKPINLEPVKKDFISKNKEVINSDINEGMIKNTNDIKYWFSDENGNQLDPTKLIDPNKLPTPYILFGPSTGMPVDNFDHKWQKGKYYIQEFNDYVKTHPLVVKNGECNFEYTIKNTSDQPTWSTRMPHDIFKHLDGGSFYGDGEISISTIPNQDKATDEYIKDLFTLGVLNYKLPDDDFEDPFTKEKGKDQKVYVTFSSNDDHITPSFDDIDKLIQLKKQIINFPKNPTSDQLNNLSNQISENGLSASSKFNVSDYVSDNGTIGSINNPDYQATLIPEYDKDGNKLDKYAGRLWVKGDPTNDGYGYTIKMHYEALDPNYTGYLGNIYGYTAAGSSGFSLGTYILPIINKTAGQATLKFYDQTTNSWLSDTDSSEGAPNESITFANGAADLNDYLGTGYEFVNITKNLSADTTQVLTNDRDNVWKNLGNYTSDENQQFVINLVHTATPTNVTKTANRTIHYVLDDGSGLPDSQKPTMNDNNGKAIENVEQTVTWNGTEFIDKITGKTVNAKQDTKGNWIVDNSAVSTTNWTTDGDTFDTFKEVPSQSVDGYTATPEKVNAEKAKMPDGDNNQEDIYVIYKNAPQKATLRFWDDNTNSAISGITDIDAQGNYKTDINFNGKDDKYNLAIAKGYEYVNVTDDATDNTLDGKTFNNVTYGKYDSIKDNNQIFTVHFKHAIVPVTPDKPGNGLDDKTLSKTVTETVHYVGNGAVVPSDKTFDLNFNGTAYYDSVTKNWTDAQGKELTDQKNPVQTWTPEKGTSFDIVESPTINGYHVVSVKDHTDSTKDYNDGQNNVKKLNGISQDTPSFQVDVTYMPDAPIYHLADESEHKTIKRIINYLDSETNLPISVEPAVNQEVTLTRTKIFDQNNKFIGYGTISSDGKQFMFKDWHSIKDSSDTLSEVKSADLSEYGYKHQMHFIDGSKADIVEGVKVDGNTPENITINVYYDHDTVPVEPTDPKKPTDPINSKHPEGPKYPNNVDENSLNKTITRTINYVDSDGNPVNGSPDGKNTYKQIVKFTRTAIVDKVNGKLLGYDIDNDGKVDVNANNGDYAWKSDNNIFDEVISKKPSEINYDYVNIAKVGKETVSYNSDNETVKVIYSKTPIIVYHSGNTETKNITRTIKYIDSTTEQSIPSNLAQTQTQPITFTRTQILDKDGKIVAYGVVSKDGTSYTLQDWTANTDWPEVVSPDLSEKGYTAPSIAKVDEAKPSVDTGDQTIIVKYGHQIIPVTPDNPSDKYKSTDLQKDVTRTIHYVDEANTSTHLSPDVTQTLHFVGQGTIDKVTGNLVNINDDGTIKDQNGSLTWYLKNSKEDNGTFVAVTSPEIAGYTIDKVDNDTTDNKNVDSKTISHDIEGNKVPDVTVYYKVNAPVIGEQYAEVHYLDEDNNNTQIATSGRMHGKANTSIGYSTKDELKSLEKQGYELVSNGYDQDGIPVYDNNSNNDQEFNVILRHKVIPVTPDTPPTDVPDDTPSEALPENLIKDATRTIHYVLDDGSGVPDSQKPTMKGDNGADLPDITQIVTWHGTAYIDKVTGKMVNAKSDGNNSYIIDTNNENVPKIIWSEASGKFDKEDSPVVKGYTSNPEAVGEEIPNMPEGKNAHEDVYVLYKSKPVTPPATEDQKASLTVIDETTGKQLNQYTNTGKSGSQINFGNASQDIKSYLDNGYVWDVTKTTDNAKDYTGLGIDIFDNENSKDQSWTVYLKHGVKHVDKDHPGNGYKSSDLYDDVTTTIHYVDRQGNKLADDVVKVAHFEAKGDYDTVTGKWVTVDKDGNITGESKGLTWNQTSQIQDAIPAKNITGYEVIDVHSDSDPKLNVDRTTGAIASQTMTPDTKDSVVIVIYDKKSNPTPEPQPTAPQPTLPSSNPSSTPTTNPAPSNPTEPIEPSTPEPNIPDTPEPDIPETPKHHKKTPTPKRTSENFAPHAQSWDNVAPHSQNNTMPNGESVSDQGQIIDSEGNVIGYIDKNGNAHYYALPQTGENDNEDVAALIAGGVAVSMSLLGLAGVKKRRRN